MYKALYGVTAAMLGLVVGIFTAVAPAIAHHSFALFDSTKTVALEGTVKRFDWTNPHSWITLEVQGAQNKSVEWMIELPSAGALARDGWNKNYVKVGEKLILRVNPMKDGTRGGSLQSFTPGNRAPKTP